MKWFLVFLLFSGSALAQGTYVKIDTLSDGAICHSEMVDGKLHGTRTFYVDGYLYCVESFHRGVISGPEWWYYKDGSLMAISHFKNGFFHGLFEKYTEDGQIKSSNYYEYGVRVTKEYYTSLYNENGETK